MNTAKSVLKLQNILKPSFPNFYVSNCASNKNLLKTQSIHQFIQQNISNENLQYQNKNPKVICHRGRSDLYPQNTIQSITQGLSTSDLVEFDVMLTKDEQVIVFHDRFLSQITNIENISYFSNRKTIDNLNQFGQLPRKDWWVKEFNLSQLQKVSVLQKHRTRPQFTGAHYKIPTLEEVIQKCLSIQKHNQHKSGILIEIKTQRQNLITSQRDVALLFKIKEILKKYGLDTNQKCMQQNLPVIVQSFNHEAIQKFHQMCPQIPLSHLYYDEDQNISENYILNHRTNSSIGVGISTKHLRKEFIEMCKKINYQIFYWSVKDDDPEIPLGFKTYNEFYKHLHAFNIDGIITDFAANCKHALAFPNQ